MSLVHSKFDWHMAQTNFIRYCMNVVIYCWLHFNHQKTRSRVPERPRGFLAFWNLPFCGICNPYSILRWWSRKGGSQNAVKRKALNQNQRFAAVPRPFLWRALKSAHFFLLLLIICTVVQSHAIYCPHFVRTYRHRQMFSSEDSLLSRCSLKKHCVLRNLSSLATGDQSFVRPGAWIDLLHVSCLFSQTAFWQDSLHGGSACELCTQRPTLYSHRS